MSSSDIIGRAKYVSGEMFDLTAASFNNEFGAEHNKCVIKHGINFPLSKFITELEMIIAGTDDDKTDKRKTRLAFLRTCESSTIVEEFFSLFTNYLNGGGTDSTRTNWAMQQYYDNFMVITAAGGNIIILFAQLLANIIDVFKCKVNAQEDSSFDGSAADDWDIVDPNYESQDFPTHAAAGRAQAMFSTSFGRWHKNFWDIINDTYSSLTRTNKILLEGLASVNGQFSKQQLCFMIAKHFIELDEADDRTMRTLWNVALSDISDFDFKLSPNIHPSLAGDPEATLVDALTSAFSGLGTEPDSSAASSLIRELFSNIKSDDSAGFLLFRVKTLIDCTTDYRQQYTARQLKSMQRDCANRLGNWVWGLYPQIMQQNYLTDVPQGSDCWNYLNYLNEKKQAIRDATQNSIDETMKFHQAGYFKPANPLGEMFAMVNAAQNSTEAIIDYISNITYHMNIYIEKWETINSRGENILSASAAPGLHEGGLPARFSHKSVCYNFLSLDTILTVDDGLVARLSADILNYFLNNPNFNTELILDNLITTFNAKRAALTGTASQCFMPPSDLLAVPTNKDFNGPLRTIKHILDGTRYSELGYPDGIRITLNAIETEDQIGDTNLDTIELAAQILVKDDRSIQRGYTPLASGLKKHIRAKKVKTRRRKQQKQKQKQKSLKLKKQRQRQRQKTRKVTLKRKMR
jgi:hypothetical protein